METILYLSSNLVHVYAVYIFFQLILGESRFNKWIEALTFLGYYAMNSVGFLLFDNLIVNLLTNIVPLFLISFQYHKSILGRKIFCALSACALGMFTDLLIFSVLPPDSVLVEKGVFQSVLLLIFVFILKHFITNRETELKSNHIWFIVLISLGTITVGQLTINEFNFKSLLVSVILLLINFLNFYMYDKDLKQLQMQHTMHMIEISNKAYQNQLDILNESQKKIRLLKHDITNHMYKIKKLVTDGKYEKAVEYIDQMGEFTSVDKEYVSTGNNDIDCLLNYKLSLANEMGVEFYCDICLPDKLVVTSFDLNTIIGNLLDNSLQALKNTDDKKLVVKIKYYKGCIKMYIENTYNPESNSENKKDGEHGLGLLSVRRAIEKYHGILEINPADKKFCVNAFMYNSLE
ncbi:sensor histidine kinase [Porcipelethomonas sp.]|uniref:sensor histidine kinase n=1 Tax=Porcipelethomonas sp. TaxID=2981675 RepID=UPI003EF76CB4